MKVAIVGGSGYVGGELLRLLLRHPEVEVVQVTSDSMAGKPIGRAHPNLRKVSPLLFAPHARLQPADATFIATPHGESMGRVPGDPHVGRIRLRPLGRFPASGPGAISPLLRPVPPEARPPLDGGLRPPRVPPRRDPDRVHRGRPRMHRDRIDPRPAAARGRLDSSTPSTWSSTRSPVPRPAGAIPGRGLARGTFRGHARLCAFRPSSHRRDRTGDRGPRGPHLPRGRGGPGRPRDRPRIRHSGTSTRRSSGGRTGPRYGSEPFVRIVHESDGFFREPEPKILAGTNYCDLGFAVDPHAHRVVALAAIDNLGKGAAGNAVQCLNLRAGFSETTGLDFLGLHPI